jgi:hypothetical protein
LKKILLTCCLLLAFTFAYSQNAEIPRWSFTAHGIFQAFKIPLAHPSVYLTNKGFSAAATYDLSRKTTFQQNLEFGYYFNPYHGNTYLFFTTCSYNPLHSSSVQAGVSLGAGYMNSGFSNGGWEQNTEGEWIETSNRKGTFFIPADLHFRFRVFENARYRLSPVVAYQLNVLFGYSDAATILPQSMVKIGITLNLK